MGLLDFLSTDEARLGIGLLGASGWQPQPMNFGQRVNSALLQDDARKTQDDARKLNALKQQGLLAQMEQEKLMNPLLLDSAKAQTTKLTAEADKATRFNNFYSPENMRQFMTPGVSAVPSVPDELGGGPSREAIPPSLNFGRLLQSGVTAGVVDPEKLLNHQSNIDLKKEAIEDKRRARAEQIQTRLYDIETRSQDRNAGIEAANERSRESLALRRELQSLQRDRNLKPGERYNLDGQIEVIPGSTEYVRRSNSHSKDYQTVEVADNKADNAIKKIDKILDVKNEAAFKNNFGGYNALISQRFPGATQDIKAILESLQSDLKVAGLDVARVGGSIGAMTEREWPIVQKMVANITHMLGEKEAKDQLDEVRQYLQRIRNITRDAYDNEWGGSQFHKNVKPPTAGKSMTMADVAATAKSRGMTEKQVIDAARARGYEVK